MPTPTTPVSTLVSGILGDGDSNQSALNQEGRLIVFASDAFNLSDKAFGLNNIYLKDTQSGVVTLLNMTAAGIVADSNSFDPTISGDGQWVAFASYGANLTAKDTNNDSDIFLKNTQTGALTLVSTLSDGAAGDKGSSHPVLSRDGRYIVFQSQASNLIPGDGNGAVDIYFRDLQSSTLSLLSRNNERVIGNGNSVTPVMSADGSWVAFASDASNLVKNDRNSMQDVFLTNTQNGQVVLISANGLGGAASGFSDSPSISADGKKVAFRSYATDLLADVENDGYSDIYVKDINNGSLKLVSIGVDNKPADGNCYDPVISPDGRYVAFVSEASNLIQGDNNNVDDVFLADLLTGVITRMEVVGSVVGHNGYPAFSGDSSLLVFSHRDNLSNNLYAWRSALPTLTIANANITVDEGNSGVTSAVITVNLSVPSTQSVTVDYRTVDGVATAGNDYDSLNNRLIFEPNQTSKTITVPIRGDLRQETHETFQLVLFDPVNAALGNPAGATVTIRNDDFNQPVSGEVKIIGSAIVEQTLTIDSSALKDGDGLGAIRYEWQADGGSIGTGNAYKLTANEINKTITVTARYTDGQGTPESSISQSTAAVQPVQLNRVPIATPDSKTLSEDAAVTTATGNVLANDSDPDNAQANALRVGEINGQEKLINTRLNGAYGILTLQANGGYTYALNNTATPVQALKKGAVVMDKFTYTAIDNAGAKATADLIFNITGQNDAPVLSNTFLKTRKLPDVDNMLPGKIDYTIPAATFTDRDQGDVLTYTAAIQTAIGQPFTPLPVWLTFDAGKGRFTGTLAGTNVNTTELSITITATDSAGAKADVGLKLFMGPGTPANDSIPGSSLDDRIDGRGGNDNIKGNLGADTLYGFIGNDSIDGGDGNDNLWGGAGKDTLIGGKDNDRLTGDEDNDSLNGGAGNDIMNGGVGNDTMDGGNGNDTYMIDSAGDIIIESNPNSSAAEGGRDIVRTSINFNAQKSAPNIENFMVEGSRTVSIRANDLLNQITGNDASNRLEGLSGNDIIVGNSGDDILDGGLGIDSLIGGDGSDTYLINNTEDIITETQADGDQDKIVSSASYQLGDNIEVLELVGAALEGNGNTLGNSITGNANNNELNGYEGNDILNGFGGNDTISGGPGDDNIDGGEGIDIAVYPNPIEDYDPKDANDDSITLEDISTNQGKDFLKGIELFEFAGEQLTLRQVFEYANQIVVGIVQ